MDVAVAAEPESAIEGETGDVDATVDATEDVTEDVTGDATEDVIGGATEAQGATDDDGETVAGIEEREAARVPLS